MRNEKIMTTLLVWSLAVAMFITPVYADNENSVVLPQPVESSAIIEDSQAGVDDSAAIESSIITEEGSQTSEPVTALSEVILSIQALPEVDEIIASDEDQVLAIRKAYDDLLAEEKTKVWNFDKLTKAEEKILLLKETSGYSYTFTITQQTPTLGLLMGFPEKEEAKSFILTSPSGVSMEASVCQPELTGDSFHASIVQVEAYYEIHIDKAEQGNWLITTKEPISFSVIEYIPEESEEDSSSSDSSETVQEKEGSKVKALYEFLREKAMTKEGIYVIAAVFVLLLTVIITIIIAKRKKKKSRRSEEGAKNNSSTPENKVEPGGEIKEEKLQEAPKELSEEDKIRAQIEQYMRKNNYATSAPEEKKEKISEKIQQELTIEREVEYLDVDEMDNDVTLVEYADSAVGPVPEKKEEVKPRRRQSFFTEDRFGN